MKHSFILYLSLIASSLVLPITALSESGTDVSKKQPAIGASSTIVHNKQPEIGASSTIVHNKQPEIGTSGTDVGGASSIDADNEQPAVIKVIGAPFGIYSAMSRGDKCHIFTGAVSEAISKEEGQSLKIKVEGEKDIVILCKGKNGISITRE